MISGGGGGGWLTTGGPPCTGVVGGCPVAPRVTAGRHHSSPLKIWFEVNAAPLDALKIAPPGTTYGVASTGKPTV